MVQWGAEAPTTVTRLALTATASGSFPLAGPLQGSDQQLVTLLCRNRRHPGSLKEKHG